ncbi:MAG: ATP-binding protein [Elainellaceae cyanobacterium]
MRLNVLLDEISLDRFDLVSVEMALNLLIPAFDISLNWQALTWFFAAMAIATSLIAIFCWRRLWSIARDEALCVAVFNLLPDVVIRMKQDGTLVGVRAGHQFLSSQPLKQLVGQNIHDVLPEAIATQQLQLMERAIATGEILTSEFMVEVEGKPRWRKVRMAAQTKTEVLMIVRDTTDYQQVMTEFCQQEEQSRAMLTAIPDLIFQLSSDGTALSHIRPGHMTDLLPEEFDPVGKHVSDYLTPDHAQRNLDSVRRVLETREVLIYEQDVIVDGCIQHEEVRVVASGNDRALFMVRDITSYRHSEAERERTEQLLQQQLNRVLLLEQVTHEIRSHLDRQHIFIAASIQIGRAFGVNRCLIHTYRADSPPTIRLVAEYDEIGYDPLESLEIPVRGNAHAEAILANDRAIASDDVFAEPLLADMQDTCAQVQLKSLLAIRTSYQDRPNGLICLHQCDLHRSWTHDEITLLEAVAAQVGIALYHAQLLEQEQLQQDELRHKSQALEDATHEAQKANRAKSAFLAHMSHELRTPLNAILGFAQVIQLDETLPEETQDFLQIILKSGEHLLQLINGVLDLSKVESGAISLEVHEFCLSNLINQVEEMFQHQIDQKGLSLSTTFLDGVPTRLSADEGKLRQVLINLVGNAVKFTDQGSIQIRISVVSKPDDCPGHPFPEWAIAATQTISKPSSFPSSVDLSQGSSLMADDSAASDQQALIYLCIEIKDTGRGIETHEIDRIFAAFAQAEVGQLSSNGTGLGLTISKRFIELMGGTISTHSQRNLGSTFAFTIPVVSSLSGVTHPPVHSLAPSLPALAFPTAALQSMPASWQQLLYGAVIRCDSATAKDLLTQIPTQEAHLAEALDVLLQSFQFEQVIDLLELAEP